MADKVVVDDYSVGTLFSIKDLVRGVWCDPLVFFGPRAEERVRDLYKRAVPAICSEFQDGSRKVSDFDLYRVGTFDAKTGIFVTEPNGPALLV